MPSKGLSIVGSSRANGDREENDFYPTPSFVTEALMAREQFIGNVLEPACGDGSMSRVIEKYNPVVSYDLIYRGYGSGSRDFLKSPYLSYSNVITNPPYKLALEFVNTSKLVADKKIAMFLKTTFLEGERRYSMFQDRDFPLKRVYQFCRRVNLYKNGQSMRRGKKIASGMIAFAWFVWERGYRGRPEIEWIN